MSYHTGAVLEGITIPISAEMQAYDNWALIVKPVKTWALVNDEWVEKSNLDFTGITGFNAGKWNPMLFFVSGIQSTLRLGSRNVGFRYFSGQASYSDGTAGNNFAGKGTLSGTTLTFSSLNGAKVCVADGGLTFAYDLWGWNNA